MLVVLSAMNGLLESEPRHVHMCGNRCVVPILDLDINFWTRKPEEIPPIRLAAFEDRGRYKKIDGKMVAVLELVEYPEKS